MKTDQKKNKKFFNKNKRAIAVILSITLIVTMSAFYSAAVEERDKKIEQEELAAAAQMAEDTNAINVTLNDLDEDVLVQNVENGTALKELNLPKELEGKDSQNENIKVPDVEWTSKPEYDSNEAGEYIFEAKLPEGYFSTEIELPEIKIIVEEPVKEDDSEDSDEIDAEKTTSDTTSAKTTKKVSTKAGRATVEIPFTTNNKEKGYTIVQSQILFNGILYTGSTPPPTLPLMKDGDLVSLFFDWQLTESWEDSVGPIEAGDYFFLEVDEGFPIVIDEDEIVDVFFTTNSGAVKIGELNWVISGKGPGGVTIDPSSGKRYLKLVFNDYLNDFSEISGTIELATKVSTSNVPYDSETYTPVEGGGSFEFTFDPEPPKESSVDKEVTGYKENKGALEEISWRIDYNKEKYKLVAPVVINDIYHTSAQGYKPHTLIDGTIKLFPLDENGNVGTEISIPKANITSDGNGFSVTIPEDYIQKNPNQTFRLTYSTKPDSSSTSKSKVYGNTAKVDNKSDAATFTETDSSKAGTYTQDKVGGEDYITWKVFINGNNGAVPSSFNIVDKLPPGLGTPSAFSLKYCKNNTATGNELWPKDISTSNKAISNIVVTASGISFTLAGKNEDGSNLGYYLTYKTKVTDESLSVYNNSIIVIEKKYEGKVNNPTVDPTKGRTKPLLIKSGTLPTAGQPKVENGEMTGYISWTSQIHPYRETLAGLELVDTFGAHIPSDISMTLIPETLKITYGDSPSAVVLENKTGSSFGAGPNEYMVTESNTGGFKVKFHDNFVVDGKVLYLAYDTKYTLSLLDENGQLKENAFPSYTFVNNIEGTYTGGTLTKVSSSVNVGDKKTTDNGHKIGNLINGVIKWSVTYNTNRYDFSTTSPSSITMIDTLPAPASAGSPDAGGAVKYVDGSIVVKDLTDNIILPAEEYELTITEDVDYGYSTQLKLVILNPKDHAFQVDYDTKLFGQPLPTGKNYVNHVKVNNGREFSDSVASTNPSLITKEGMASGKLTSGLVDWVITLNAAYTSIFDAEVVDNIGLGHVILPDTIKIIDTGLDGKQTTELQKDTDYTLEINHNSADLVTPVKINFLNPITTKLLIKYTTSLDKETLQQVDDGSGKYVVDNDVTLNGSNITSETKFKEVKDAWSVFVGAARGKRIRTNIFKEAETPVGERLEGGVFRIVSLDKVASDAAFFDKTVETLVDGSISVFLPAGEYSVTEILPPMGYTYSNINEQKIEITDDDISNKNIQSLIFINPKGTIACEVDKDTIKRSSFAYDNLEQEGIQNTGLEQYRYDIDFRSTSNAEAKFYWVDDPLENVSQGHVLVDAIWTPIVWGDIDGEYNILYKTKNGSGNGGAAVTPPDAPPGYSNDGYKYWQSNMSTTSRECLTVDKLGLAKGDYITAIRYEYGSVRIGFTSKNYSDVSQNGEHRTPGGAYVLPLSVDGGKSTPLQIKNKVFNNNESGGLVSSFATGISGNVVDWTPKKPTVNNPVPPYYDELLALSPDALQPVSYMVSAQKPMSSVNIASTATSNIRTPIGSDWLRDSDADGVLTKVIVPFDVKTDEVKNDNIVMEDSFTDNAKAQGINLNGGKWYGPDGKLTTTAAKTGDFALLGVWIALMVLAVISIIMLMRMDAATKKKKANQEGGAK